MKTYEIPIVWEAYQKFEVEANSLEEAAIEALKLFLSIPDDTYVDCSFSIDGYVTEMYPDEEIDLEKVYNSI